MFGLFDCLHNGISCQASCSPEVFSPDIQNGHPFEVQDRRGHNGFHRMEDIQEVQDTRCKNGFHGLEDMQEVQGDIGEMQDMHMCTPAVKTQVTLFKNTLNIVFWYCVVTKIPLIVVLDYFPGPVHFW